MPTRFLPVLLPGAKATEIITRVVEERLRGLEERAGKAYPDGLLPGMEKLSGRERLARYVLQTEPADYLLLQEQDYLNLYKQQGAPPPISPFWLNLLSVPDAFRESQHDFTQLMKEVVAR